jgi:hypothetical protein
MIKAVVFCFNNGEEISYAVGGSGNYHLGCKSIHSYRAGEIIVEINDKVSKVYNGVPYIYTLETETKTSVETGK